MSRITRGSKFGGLRAGVTVVALVLMMVIASSRAWGAPTTFNMSSTVLGAGAPVTVASQGLKNSPLAAQQFEDVPVGNPFYDYVNNIYIDGIASGYACGGVNEPCVAPANRPYFRPNNNVTRGQMGKFIDLGRRNIADAIGTRLWITNSTDIGIVVSATVNDAIDGNTSSGLEAVQGTCTQANNNCYGIYGRAATGDRAGLFSGGRGLYASGGDDNYPAVNATTSATGAYAVDASSSNYRSVQAANSTTSWYGLYVAVPTGSTVGAYVNGNTYVNGNLTVTGSKTGYVVDIMQNADNANLEPGDVVTIVGNSTAVLGDIPVTMVKKASNAYDTGVVGIVDQTVYVPDAATKATYEAEQAAVRDVLARRESGQSQADAAGLKFDPGSIPMPAQTISDEQGTIHAISNVANVPANGYTNVVTLGAYKGVKVDASFGAVHAGDLLTSSPHAGYAMKVTDRAQGSGAVIGKALGNLDSGTGLVPVMVTLK
jgi:hypothetical protein